MVKWCARCCKYHQVGQKCPKAPKASAPRKHDFYGGGNWRKCRDGIAQHYNFIDVWELGKTGKLVQVPVGIVHHIEEYLKRADLKYTADNLIYVSRASHDEIHNLYDTFRKDEALEIIKRGIERFESYNAG